MFQRFYPDQPSAVAEQFAKQAFSVSAKISAAQLQGHFMLHKEDPVKAIQNVEMLKS